MSGESGSAAVVLFWFGSLAADAEGAAVVVGVVAVDAAPGNWPLPQAGQMQTLPRASGAIWARASRETGALMHQQLSAGRPAMMAHWLAWPHRGQGWAAEVTGVADIIGLTEKCSDLGESGKCRPWHSACAVLLRHV